MPCFVRWSSKATPLLSLFSSFKESRFFAYNSVAENETNCSKLRKGLRTIGAMVDLASHCFVGLITHSGKFAVSNSASSSPSLAFQRRSPIWPGSLSRKFDAGHLDLRCLPLAPSPLYPLWETSMEEDEFCSDYANPEGDYPNVQVKFQLVKQCFFGEEVFVVGDDPKLGLWDPSHAIPMEWSAGHVWKAQLVLPAKRQIMFKFIIKGILGKIIWQSGKDRSFKTWETDKVVLVEEDWENVHYRNIGEEPLNDDLQDTSLNN